MTNNILGDALERHYSQNKDRVALKSKNCSAGITYENLYILSGKIYAYLKDHNIGKEDFVVILLPRDVGAYICMAGVVKAGAAFTIIEDTYPKQRIDYIINDVKPKIVIDSKLYEEMMQYSFIKGYEEVNLHDAAFAVYTSGSTGTPKGVLHEYGQLIRLIESVYDFRRFKSINNELCCGINSPLGFWASYGLFFYLFYLGECGYIVDYDTVKNFKSYGELIEKEDINILFFTPSLLRAFGNIPANVLSIIIGGEKADSVYIEEGPVIFNIYASSEAGQHITCFEIDKQYDNVPAGKSISGMKIDIMDEDNKPTDVGEICFENPYFRGYINLPEQTRQVMIDGVYHTGDIGYFDENENLVVCGRKDDMIKVNGNRIEPMEIENALKNILNVKNVVAKGFNEADRSFIAAYFIKEELGAKGLYCDEKLEIDYDDLQQKLLDILPYYMIPTYYIALDEYPVNANGKVIRRLLEIPKANEYHNEEAKYNNEIEAYLCELFKEVLQLDYVGINDDFYHMGGDSVTSMKLMSECKLKFLTVNDLFTYRTPYKIAKYYIEKYDLNVDFEQKNKLALTKPQPILAEMVSFLDLQFGVPGSTIWNLPVLLKLKKDIDANRFKNAVDKVLQHHPVYSTVIFFDEDNEIRQKYCPDLYEETRITKLSKEEFKKTKKQLVKPFNNLMNSLLYRKEIYVVEDEVYFFVDTYHLITDGTSINLVMQQINDYYYDDTITLPTDYYYLVTNEIYTSQKMYKDASNEVNIYYKNLSDKFLSDEKFVSAYYPDSVIEDFTKKTIVEAFSIKKADVCAYVKNNSLTENEFFVACCLLAVAKRNRHSKVMLQFIQNGRNNNLVMSSCGLFFNILAVFADFSQYKTLGDYLKDVARQVKFGIANNNYNTDTMLDEVFAYSVYFLYQKDIFSIDRFEFVDELIHLKNDLAAADSLIEFDVIDSSNVKDYMVEVSYAFGYYKEKTIKRFIDDFIMIAKSIINADTDISINEIIPINKYKGNDKLKLISKYMKKEKTDN